MFQFGSYRIISSIKFCLVIFISAAISTPAFAEYYMVSPYYSDCDSCCCDVVKKKRHIKHVRHVKHRCADYVVTTAPVEMTSEYAWIPDPWDP